MKRKTVLSLSMLFISVLAAAEPLILTRDICFELALENNPRLQNAETLKESAIRADKNRWNLLLPDVGASAGISGGGAAGEEQSYSLNTGISARYTLVPALKETIRQLAIEHERQRLSYEETKREILQAVETEFYYLIAEKGSLDIREKDIALARQAYEQTRVQFENGLVPEIEVMQARVNAANLIPQFSSAKAAYNSRFKEFLLVLGIDPATEAKLEGTIEIDDIAINGEELISRYLDNRRDIAIQRKTLEKVQSLLISAGNQRALPSLSLSAGWSDSTPDPFSSSTWNDADFQGSTSLGISLSLSLDSYLPGSRDDLEVRNRKDNVAIEERALKTRIKEAALEIINLVETLETDKENLELSKLNLELSEASYEMTKISFERGTAPRTSLDDAQQELLTARQNLLKSRFSFKRDLIALKGALGLDADEQL